VTPMASEAVELAPSEHAGLTVALETLPPGRRAVLSALKQHGEASAEDVAQALGVTVSAVRQHLAPLEEHGLVAHRDERPGPGRPRRRYCLTPAAESLWPKRYGQLANQLLTFIGDADPALVEQAFEHRRRARAERARERLGNRSFDDRVRELARILDDDGYLASCEQEQDGSWRVVEHNCAILDVAERYGSACGSELAFLRDALPDADVQRTAHMMAGAHVCAYGIRRASRPTP
jgi:DeoR family suf operon transcriptional repressor